MGDLVEQQAVERVGGDVGQSRHRRPRRGGPLAGERLVADDDHPLGAERQRGRDRRVQARRAVDVVTGGAERRGHLDRREQQRDRGRRAHVLALQARVDVLDLAVRARRRRGALDEPDRHAALDRGGDDADGVHQAARRRSRAARPSRSSRRGCAPAATDRAATRRAGRAVRAPRPPAAAGRSPVPTPITGEITLPLRTERQWSRKTAACSDAGQRRDRRDDRGVDPADARPAHDLDPLAAVGERGDEHGQRARLVGAARTAAGEDQADLHDATKRGAVTSAPPTGPRAKISRGRYARRGQRRLAARVEREQAVDAAEAEDRGRLALGEHERDARRRARAPAPTRSAAPTGRRSR